MENPEYIFQLLEVFSKLKSKEIPVELEEFISYVARTGDPVFQWPFVKILLKEKLLAVLKDFIEDSPSLDIPHCPNVDPFDYEIMKTNLLDRIDSFVFAPFTVQRICELLSDPRKEYNRIDKYMRAIEKNVLVVTTRDSCLKRSLEDSDSSSESVLNGILYTKVGNSFASNHIYSSENEMDEDKIASSDSVHSVLNEWGENNPENGYKINQHEQAPLTVGFESEIQFASDKMLNDKDTDESEELKTDEYRNVSTSMDSSSFTENESLDLPQESENVQLVATEIDNTTPNLIYSERSSEYLDVAEKVIDEPINQEIDQPLQGNPLIETPILETSVTIDSTIYEDRELNITDSATCNLSIATSSVDEHLEKIVTKHEKNKPITESELISLNTEVEDVNNFIESENSDLKNTVSECTEAGDSRTDFKESVENAMELKSETIVTGECCGSDSVLVSNSVDKEDKQIQDSVSVRNNDVDTINDEHGITISENGNLEVKSNIIEPVENVQEEIDVGEEIDAVLNNEKVESFEHEEMPAEASDQKIQQVAEDEEKPESGNL